ncbi:hypothetical protein RND71_000522 [Anisodus tanguticus]|uniref:Peptidase S54 rhomboid domain-containing protein n=1 Tax=Anisodus tanguticus TaxID=243964 RepID=A0AAE1SYI1_9SOLA|nr:hypothetical protein RND71_000522 [Anisodus tanguticus]
MEMAGWASLPSNPKFPHTVSIWGPTTTHLITNAAGLRLGDFLRRRLQCSIKILTTILLAAQHIYCHVHGPKLKDAWHKWALHVTGFNILQWSQDIFSAEDMSLLFFNADESRRKFKKIQKSYSNSSRSFFSSERKWTNIFLALNILLTVLLVKATVEADYFIILAYKHIASHGLTSLHVNCYSLNSVGPGVEKVSGPRRYVALYLTSAIASSAMSSWLSKAPAVGASGAIFGLAIGLLSKGIDNWGHLGGLIGGAASSWLLGPAWKIQSISSEGQRVFADTAPIFSLIQPKRDKS